MELKSKGIVERLGGESVVANALNLHFTTVYRWHKPRIRGVQNTGGGGEIPRKHWEDLVNFAKSKNIPLSLSDFINA